MIQDTINALLSASHDHDAMSNISFAEALSVPFLSNTLTGDLTGQAANPDHDEQEVSINELRAQVGRVAQQLTLVATLRQQDVASPFLASAQAELDSLSSGLIVNLASLGALALINATRQSILDCT